MRTPITSCTSCGSSELRQLGGSYAHAQLVKCGNCGLVFSALMPDNNELYEHYSKYPRGGTVSPITIARYNELLDGFEPFRKNNRILDIGCGDGFFLEAAAKRGWKVTGTEFDPIAIDLCRKKGITIHEGKLTSINFTEEFDIVTSFEVLEHIHDGKDEMPFIHSILRKGGLFYFTTPNFNSFSRRWLKGKWTVIEYPEHLTYYTSTTLHAALIRHHFTKMKMITSGISVQRFEASRTGDKASTTGKDEAFRNTIESRPLLGFAKKIVNGLLRLTRTGDTIKGWYLRS